MSERIELKSYSSFTTRNSDLREIKEQLRRMQDSINVLHDTAKAREQRKFIRFTNLRNKNSSIVQNKKGFSTKNGRGVKGCHDIDISLG